MNLPRLDIRQTPIQIDTEVKKASYSFEPAYTKMTIEQPPAEMILHRTPIRLTINQSQCWADMDLKHIFQRNEEAAADGRQAALEYISRVTLEGEQMGAIENQGNVIVSLAKNNRISPQHAFAYGNVPGNFSLHFNITPGELNMEWRTNKPSIDAQYTPFRHHYEKGKVDHYVKQKNQLQISVIGGQINTVY